MTHSPSGSPQTAQSVLDIDLNALAENWKKLNSLCRNKAPQTQCGAVVKADAYGLGIAPVAKSLYNAGARQFFVATLEEGLELRELFDDSGISRETAEIHIFSGLLANLAPLYAENQLIPILNSLDQLGQWQSHNRGSKTRHPAMLHIDTGMARLGLDNTELERLQQDTALLKDTGITHYLHHYACADEQNSPLTKQQLTTFNQAIKHLPKAQSSLANSAACFLDPSFRGTLTRPGYALYGGNACGREESAMKPVVHARSRILQIRKIDVGQVVGYGSSYKATGPERLATVSLGYADGLLRSLSNTANLWHKGTALPIRGRVSMDSVMVDITALPENAVKEGDWLDLLGPDQAIDQLAKDAGTIGYELLTLLGQRYHRNYRTI